MSRTPASAFQTALNNASTDGIIVRRFLWVRAIDRTTNAANPKGFWTGDYNVTLNIFDGVTGLTVSRLYIGLGSSLVIPPIPRVSDLIIPNVVIQMPINNPSVLEAVGTYSVRFVEVDVHEGLLNSGRRLVSDPEYIFSGIFNARNNSRAEADGVGQIELEIMAEPLRMLSRPNVEKRSDEHQKQYAGDTFGEYGSAAMNWTVPWGENEVGATVTNSQPNKQWWNPFSWFG